MGVKVKEKILSIVLSRKLWFCFPCEIAATAMCWATRPGTTLGIISGGEWVAVTLGLAGIYVSGNVASKFAPIASAPGS